MPRIALIHAVNVAVEPIRDALQQHWPEAEAVNLLDDSLGVDRAKQEALAEGLSARINRLADYAVATAADGILFTCSAFGPAIEMAARRLPVPVLKPNEAMFEQALAAGERVGMLATFGPATATMEAEFAEAAAGRKATLRVELVAEAMTALKQGDVAAHNRLVAARAARMTDCDVIMLAHFSTARAATAARATVPVPVLTSPDAAVLKLKARLAQNAPA